MRNKIENLNLTYGVTIFNIMSKYNEFKTPNSKKIESLSNKLNDFFCWLNKEKDVNSTNVISIGNILFEDEDFRLQFIDNSYNENEIHKLAIYLLSDINVKKLNQKIKEDKNTLYLKFLLDNDIDDSINFIKDILYTNNLLYSDLILLLINNYNFPRKIEKMSINNWIIYLINTLNIMFYEFDFAINTTREELYYSSLYFLEYARSKSLFHPHSLKNEFSFNQVEFDMQRLINNFISTGFHNINDLYYLEIPEYKYFNYRKYIPIDNSKTVSNFINNIFNNLSYKQKTLIFKIATCDSKNKHDDIVIAQIDELADSLKNNKHFIIKSQSTSNNEKKLIEDSVIFAKNYYDKKNLKIIDFTYKPDYSKNSSITFLHICIRYNNYDYIYTLNKYNLSYTWKLILKDNKIYKINAYLEDDFKHLVEAMINNGKENVDEK